MGANNRAKPVGRLGDRSYPSRTPAATGSVNVLVNNKPVLRETDQGVGGWQAVDGAPCVLVNGYRLHRLGDRHSNSEQLEGSCDTVCGDYESTRSDPLSKAGEIHEPDVIFIAHSQDEAVGEEVCLLLSGEDSRTLEAEESLWSNLIGALTKVLATGDETKISAQKDRIATALTEFVKGAGTSSLTEIRRLRGKKFTYVRSKKIKNHWRRYKLTVDDRERSLRTENGQLDREKLKQKFGKVSGKLQAEFASKGGGSLLWFVPSAEQYIEEINESLKWSLREGVPPEKVNFDASADAQLLRWYARAEGTWNFNPNSGKIGLNGQISATVALAEGRLQSTAHWPNKAGHRLLVYGHDLGNVRAKADFELSGFLGATAMGSMSLEVNIKDDKLGAKGGDKSPPTAKESTPATVSGRLFAGVQVGGSFKGAIEWDNPEERKTNSQGIAEPAWNEILLAGYGVSAAAGAGLEGDFRIGLKNGKLIFRAKAGLVLGLGASGELCGSVNAKTIWAFVQFVYHKLADAAYAFLKFIATEAFDALWMLTLKVIDLGKAVFDSLEQHLVNIYEWWKARSKAKDVAESLAKRVLAQPDVLRFTAPEAKGAMLYILTKETFWLSAEGLQESAIIAILKWVQTRREFEQVCKHMTEDPTNRELDQDPSKGEARLHWLLDWGEQDEFSQLLRYWEERDRPRDSPVTSCVYLGKLPIQPCPI